MRSVTRALRTLALVCAAVAGLLLVSGPAADAHSVLVSTDPEDGTSLETLPSSMTLTFNERVTTPAYVVVEAPDGTKVSTDDARTDDTRVVASLTDAGIAGRYRASYRVVSADGHPVSGSVYFTVTSGRTVEATRDDSDADQASFLHEHRSHLVWGAAGLVAAAALLLWPRRRGEKEET